MDGVLTTWQGSYGFVAVAGTRKAAFLHRTAVLNGTPQAGDVVTFERLESTEKGPRVVGPAWIREPEQG